MDWLDKLDEDGYNLLIDEIVRHLKEGRKTMAVVKRKNEQSVGYEFYFESENSQHLPVASNLIDKHWQEAQDIISDFPQLELVRFIDSCK